MLAALEPGPGQSWLADRRNNFGQTPILAPRNCILHCFVGVLDMQSSVCQSPVGMELAGMEDFSPK